MTILKHEQILQEVVRSFTQLSQPENNQELQDTLYLYGRDEDVLRAMCEAVKKGSSGEVTMREATPEELSELISLTTSSVGNFVLESKYLIQAVMITSDGIYFCKSKNKPTD